MLEPASPEQFFCVPGEKTFMSWNITGPGNKQTLHYSISDCTGTTIASSTVNPADNGTVTVPVTLPQGFFEITFRETGQRYGIVSLPAQHSQPDQFFSIDAALSNIDLPTAVRIALLSILKRTGIGCVKDRLDWKALQIAGKQWNWQANNASEHLRQLYSAYGLRVADLFHNAPAWMCTTGKPYPQDLVAAVRSLKVVIGRWQKHWGALEAWTEPEWGPHGGNLPADQYCSFMKAAAYACSEADMRPLAGGGFAGFCPESFIDACGANELFSHLDVLTFHPYKSPDEFEEQVAHLRTQLNTYGRKNMPIWFTESILPWADDTIRPGLDSEAHAGALDLAAKTVESRACGIERFFPFLFIPYSEAGRNYGMLDKNYSPLLLFAAYAQAVRALSNLSYVGDLAVVHASIKRARVFASDEQCVIVVFAGPRAGHVMLDSRLPCQRIEGIDGRIINASSQQTIPTSDGITYIWTDYHSIAPLLKTDTRAMQLYAAGKGRADRKPDPSPIVLQHVFNPEQIQASVEGYRPRAGRAGAFPLCIRVNNFSGTDCGITLSITPDDAGLEIDGDRTVDLSVPAFSFKEITWSCRLTEAGAKKRKTRIVAAADGTGVQWISPLVIDVLTEEE